MTSAQKPNWPIIVSWVMQAVAAIIFVAMGALPKLSGSETSRALFEQVGGGDPMMYATGVAELFAAVLLLIPKTAWVGGALGALVMVGAVGSHLVTDLGIVPELPMDGELTEVPVMFPLALVLLGFCLGVVALRKLHPGAGASSGMASAPPPTP